MQRNLLFVIYALCIVLCFHTSIMGQHFKHRSVPFEEYSKTETKKEKFPVVVKALTASEQKLLQTCRDHGIENDYSSFFTALSNLSKDSLYDIRKIESILFNGVITIGKDISESVFIEDITIMDLFVEILDSKNSTISIKTARQIAMNFSPSLIKRKSSLLRSKLFPLYRKTKYEVYLYILCMTELTTKEEKQILNDTTTGKLYKAKLGDKKIEQRMIHSFNHSKVYSQKADYARKLGYIGGKQCAIALLKSTNSNIVSSDKLISIRYPIINALACIHPGNNLFNILKQLKHGETSYCRMKNRELTREEKRRLKYLLVTNKKNKIKEQFTFSYKPVLSQLKKIVEWGENKYGITVETDFSRPYIYDKN